MTHACCLDRGLRVIVTSPAGAPPCPGCDRAMVAATAAESFGCRLVATRPIPAAAGAAGAPPEPSS